MRSAFKYNSFVFAVALITILQMVVQSSQHKEKRRMKARLSPKFPQLEKINESLKNLTKSFALIKSKESDGCWALGVMAGRKAILTSGHNVGCWKTPKSLVACFYGSNNQCSPVKDFYLSKDYTFALLRLRNAPKAIPMAQLSKSMVNPGEKIIHYYWAPPVGKTSGDPILKKCQEVVLPNNKCHELKNEFCTKLERKCNQSEKRFTPGLAVSQKDNDAFIEGLEYSHNIDGISIFGQINKLQKKIEDRAQGFLTNAKKLQ